MALLARDGGVLPFQHVAGLAVIEFLLGWFPANEAERFTVMFGVAARAIFVLTVSFDHRCVKALVCREALLDFSVAVQTLQATAAAKIMAGSALRHT